MKKVKFIIIFLLAVAFILMPFPSADINIRLHFWGATEGNFALYYATQTAGFSQEQCLVKAVDSERNQVTFHLDSSLEDQLAGLRLDFPAGNNVICVSNITVSSAGIVQKQFNPCDFFAPENLTNQNDIDPISLATAQNRAYVPTTGEDPYVIAAQNLLEEIRDGYSHLRLTRLGICLFAFACYLLYKKNLFSKDA